MLVLIIELTLVALFFLGAAFFSAAEVAFLSLNSLQIERIARKNPDRARAIKLALADPAKFISAIIIGNTLVNIGISIAGFSLISRFGGYYARELAVPLITIALFMFGEMGPKRLAMLRPEPLATISVPTILATIRLTAPLHLILAKTTAIFTSHMQPTHTTLSQEEFSTVVDLSSEKGLLDDDEKTMVKGIIRLDKYQARDVMTPRVDITGIDLDDKTLRHLPLAQKAQTPYLILYHDSYDHIAGFLDVFNYLLDPHHDLAKATIPPYYVPESAPLGKLLTQLQKDKQRIAIVVDEYGQTAGLITRGDILETIVGTISHEYTQDALTIETLAPNRWLIDGQISIEEINAELNLKLSAEGVDRLAGWVAAAAERLPKPGDIIIHQGCRAIVKEMRRHRITLVILEKLPS